MEVFRTDAKYRDEVWRDQLNAAFWPTSLGSFTPHTRWNSKLGVQSFRFGRDERDGGEVAYEPASLVDYAIREGIGFILWPSEEPQPIWEFGHGDVLSYRLYGTCFVPRFWNEPEDQGQFERLEERERIQIGPPNDAMFPPLVRESVRRYMRERLGIQEPKVLLVKRPNHGSRLVFDLPPEKLGGDDGALRAFNAIAWHIPSCIPLYHMPTIVGDPNMAAF